MNDQEFLAHYGVLGMKWGKRRGGGSLAKTKPTKTKELSDDYRRVKALKKKSASEMSNNELRDVINRMQLERQYSDLKKNNSSPAKKFATDIIKDIGKETIKNTAKNEVNKVIKSMMTKKKK